MGIDCPKHTNTQVLIRRFHRRVCASSTAYRKLDVVDIMTGATPEVETLHTERVPVRRFVMVAARHVTQVDRTITIGGQV